MTPLEPLLHAIFAERGAAPVEVAVLQPADPFLDMAGEDLRRRIFLTESETGETLCLRPEFTIPVCLDHIARRAGTPRRYAYLGEVFRQRREGGNEFLQAGIEDLGAPDLAQADARCVADAQVLVSRCLPDQKLAIVLGDQSVFEAVLAALGLPRGWQKRLARAFGAPGVLAAALDTLARPERPRTAWPEAVPAGDREALAAHIDAAIEAAGLAGSGRTAEEIAARLAEKATLAQVRLEPHALDALRRFLEIDVPLEHAAATLTAFAAETGLALDAALDAFVARAKAIAAHCLPEGAVRYDAAFGRPLDYYTGLVFEVSAPGEAGVLAGGGRYDRLLTLLGATTPIPGVGFSVWLDRVARLREAAP